MDYEIEKSKTLEEIRNKVRDRIWKGKEGWALGPPPKRTWNQWLWGIKPVSTTYENPEYHAEEGLVAVGEVVWDQIVLGINEGSLGSRPAPVVESTADQKEKETFKDAETPPADAEADKKETPAAEVEPKIELSLDNLPSDFPLPALGYISGQQELSFFGRMHDFFHSRLTVEHIGQAGLNIAFGNAKNLSSLKDVVDEKDKKTMEQLDERLISKVSFYVAPQPTLTSENEESK